MCGPIRIVVVGWVEQKRNGSGFYSQTTAVGYDLDRTAQTFRTSEKFFSMSGRSDARASSAQFLMVS